MPDSIRFIGNCSSHKEQIAKNDLFDAFEFIKTVLDLIYDNELNKIISHAKKINSHRKPA